MINKNTTLSLRQKHAAVAAWNKKPGDFSAAAKAAVAPVREVRRYLSSRKGYPGRITDAKPATRLTTEQYTPNPAPVTLRPVGFLNPERRFAWEVSQ